MRSFPAGPGVTIAVDAYRGAITVAESDAPEVRVAVHFEIGADSEPDAEQMLRSVQLDFNAQDGRVSVVARRPAEARAMFVWNEDRQIEPTFRITAPRECNLQLTTRRGAIIVGNLTGDLSAHSEAGNVFFRTVGGRVQASTESGELVVSRCTGSVHARVERGTIRMGTITGTCDAANASGDIEIMAARSELRVRAEAGNAIIGLSRDYAGTADIRTSGGHVILSIDPAANCDIEATASVLARVQSRLPLVEEQREARKLVGRLNRGGARVVAHASGGDVKLLPGPSPFP